MEMHQLRYVVAVARTGNFSRAAEQCHVAQPSLSQQVHKLEDELGERLFHRMKRHVKLTSVGEVFLRRAMRILEEVDAAKAEAAEAHEQVRGTLTVGVLPTIAPYILPQVLMEFTGAHPGVELIVQEDTTAQLLRLAHRFEIDLALVSDPIEDSGIQTRELMTEELLLALPPGHALTGKKSIAIKDIEQERLIVMREGHCLGDQVLNFCDRQKVRPVVSFRSSQLETVQALVSCGVGLSLIPAMAVKPDGETSPEYRSLSAPKPRRKILAAWAKERRLGGAAKVFIEALAKAVDRSRNSRTD